MSSRLHFMTCAVIATALALAACADHPSTGATAGATGGGSDRVTMAPPLPKCCWVNAVTGNDSNPGSSFRPFKTITQAFLMVPRAGTVRVAPGLYDVNNGETFPLNVPVGVRLLGDEPNKGAGSPATVIQGTGWVVSILSAALTADSEATIAGFQFVGVTANPNIGVTAYLTHDGVTFRNNTLDGSGVTSTGIYVQSSSNHRIAGNNAQYFTAGLAFVGGGTDSRVENNVFTYNAYGVEFDVLGGDLGGGATGSVGGNRLFCNANADLWTALGTGTIYAANNVWDHAPPAGNDIFNNSGIPIVTTGATLEPDHCP